MGFDGWDDYLIIDVTHKFSTPCSYTATVLQVRNYLCCHLANENNKSNEVQPTALYLHWLI